MMSSTRLRNSGLKWRFSSSLTLPCIRSYDVAVSPSTWNPTGPPAMSRAPRLVVMMMTVFLKSMMRP